MAYGKGTERSRPTPEERGTQNKLEAPSRGVERIVPRQRVRGDRGTAPTQNVQRTDASFAQSIQRIDPALLLSRLDQMRTEDLIRLYADAFSTGARTILSKSYGVNVSRVYTREWLRDNLPELRQRLLVRFSAAASRGRFETTRWYLDFIGGRPPRGDRGSRISAPEQAKQQLREILQQGVEMGAGPAGWRETGRQFAREAIEHFRRHLEAFGPIAGRLVFYGNKARGYFDWLNYAGALRTYSERAKSLAESRGGSGRLSGRHTTHSVAAMEAAERAYASLGREQKEALYRVLKGENRRLQIVLQEERERQIRRLMNLRGENWSEDKIRGLTGAELQGGR